MNEMIERVALAIGDELEKRGIITSGLDVLAIVAIEALRIPTEAMVEAAPYDRLDFNPGEIFTAMIDVTLK